MVLQWPPWGAVLLMFARAVSVLLCSSDLQIHTQSPAAPHGWWFSTAFKAMMACCSSLVRLFLFCISLCSPVLCWHLSISPCIDVPWTQLEECDWEWSQCWIGQCECFCFLTVRRVEWTCFPPLLALDSPLDSLEPLFPRHYIDVHNLTGVVDKPSFRIAQFGVRLLSPASITVTWTVILSNHYSLSQIT